MHIALTAKKLSTQEAENILEMIYQLYHGRSVDRVGRETYTSILTEHGFLGLVYVLDQVIQSQEMDNRARDELQTLWMEHLGRKPTRDERSQYGKTLRFFRETGRQQLVSSIALAEQLRQQASSWIQSGQPGEAQKLLDRAVNEGIPSWRVWHDHGLVLFRQKRFEDAVHSYQMAIQRNAQDDSWIWSCEDLKWCYDSLAKRKSDWYMAGLDFFRQVIELYPQRWIAWHERGFLAWKAGNLTDAIHYYQEAINRNEDDSWLWSCEDLRWCYAEANRKEEAYEYFMKLTQERPRRWGAWHSRAWLEWQHKKLHSAAIESYQRAIDTHPDNGFFWSWQDMGGCLSELRRFQEAYEAYRKASTIQTENPDAWHNLYLMIKHLDNWSIAIEHYKEAAQLISCGPAWFWYGLGDCYRYKSQPQLVLAWKAYQRALKVDPEFQAAKSAIEQLGNEPWVELRELLSERLDLEELKDICFHLDVDPDDLSSQGKKAQIRELIKHCRRHQREDDLLQQIQQIRPDVIADPI